MDTKKTAIIILIILILIIGGYFIWKNYFSPISNPTTEVINSVANEEDARLRIIDRDIQRTEDLRAIGIALIGYFQDRKYQYPKTSGTEKISDENSPTFKILKDGGYLDKLYQDPVSDKNYYGYTSDGTRFELTSILENPNDSRCADKSGLCVYRYTSEEANVQEIEKDDYINDYEPYFE